MSGRQCDAGVVGLGVMGVNLALNMADHGLAVALYNRTPAVTDDVVARHAPAGFGPAGGSIAGFHELRHFARALRPPRRVVIMVKAGQPTDAVIDALAELLEPGDLIVDGGNAHWADTVRREKAVRARRLRYIGSGVSGGETGARFGPSLMPGGEPDAWAVLEPVWTAIAAKVDPRTGREITGAAPGSPVRAPEAEPCAALVGPGGSGHYVKMVHNGIEYADMQVIAEAYHLLRTIGGMEPAEIAAVFRDWTRGDLDSFLIEVTAEVLAHRDASTGRPFVDVVVDAVGQKGTGSWTAVSALELGVPAPTIAEAVLARSLSALRAQRARAASTLPGPAPTAAIARADLVAAVEGALYASKVCAYAQGFALMRAASDASEWNLDMARLARLWRGGCIIRARLLHQIAGAFDAEPALPNLLLDARTAEALRARHEGWRRVVASAATAGVAAPAIASALAYYDGLRAQRSPGALVQAQRDFFGSHQYQRVDRGDAWFHTDWPHPDRPEHEVGP